MINKRAKMTCRICLGNGSINIYENKSGDYTFHSMMETLFTFKITASVEFPQNICKKCSNQVTSSYKLRKLAEETNEKLLKMIMESNLNNTKNAFLVIKEENDPEENTLDCDKDSEELQNLLLISINKNNENEIVGTCVKEENNVEECNTADIEYNIRGSLDNSDDKHVVDDLEHSDVLQVGKIIFEKSEYKSESNPEFDTVTKKPARSRKKSKKERLLKCKVKKEKLPTVCDTCGKSVKNIKDHTKLHLPNKRLYPCGSCTKVFQSHSARRHHNNVIHLGVRYFCTICNKFYSVTLSDHNRLYHSQRDQDYECSYCNKKFRFKGTLKHHINSHTNEKRHLCTVCGKGFNCQTDANYHKRSVHDKEKLHICQYCSKAFFFLAALKAHITIHTDGGFKCTECDKTLSTKNSLSNHMKLHGEKRISCTLCNREFHSRGNLNLHMLTHTKEKKHPCKYCDIKFRRTDHRNRHEKTAHENKIK